MKAFEKQKGFVLMVVLLITAALSIAVLMESDTRTAERLSSVRQKNDVRARAIAESCVQRALRLARSAQNENPCGGAPNTLTPPCDFDLLLDPDENDWPVVADWSNTFMPPDPGTAGSGVAYVPKAAGALDDETKALHQFRVIPTDGGACLIRYDDNDDDLLGPLGMSGHEHPESSPLTEGPSAGDIPIRDRDRSIIITAIGIYPYGGANPADAYANAATRVTKRGILRTVISSTSAVPGMWVGGDWDSGNNTELCGTGGGFRHNGGSVSAGNNTCVCGENGDSSEFGHCGATCAGGEICATENVDNTDTPPPGVVIPPVAPNTLMPPLPPLPPAAASWRDGAALGPSTNIGNTDHCEFWFTRSIVGANANPETGVVYMWDDSENDPGAYWATNIGGDGGQADDSVSCVNYTVPAGNVVPRPCTIDTATTPGSFDAVTCPDGEISMCWKPVALLELIPSSPQFPAGTESTRINLLGTKYERFRPRGGVTIPFRNSASTYGGVCGASNGSGAFGQRGIMVTKGADAHWIEGQSLLFGLGTSADGDYWPSKGVFLFFDSVGAPGPSDSARRVEFSQTFGQPNDPIRATIISDRWIENDDGDDFNLCCPDCTCSGMGTCTAADLETANGYAVWAPGAQCDLMEVERVQGNLYCKAIILGPDNGADDCVAGNVFAGGSEDDDAMGNDSHCGSTGNCGDPGVCISNGLTVYGSVVAKGGIQGQAGSQFKGSVLAGENVCWTTDGLDATSLIAAWGGVWPGGDPTLGDLYLQTNRVGADSTLDPPEITPMIMVRKSIHYDGNGGAVRAQEIVVGEDVDGDSDNGLELGLRLPATLAPSAPQGVTRVGGEIKKFKNAARLDGRFEVTGDVKLGNNSVLLFHDLNAATSVEEDMSWFEAFW